MSIEQGGPIIRDLVQKLRIGREAFPMPANGSPIRPVWINHDSSPDTLHKPIQVLEANGADLVDIHRLFRQYRESKGKPEQTEWALSPIPKSRVRGLYKMSPQILRAEIRNAFDPLFRCVNPSLNSILGPGFNTHDWEHVEHVIDSGLELSKKIPMPENWRARFERIFTIAAGIHDLGNVVARDVHGDVSIRMAAHRLPALKDDKRGWKIAAKAVWFHEPKMLESAIDTKERKVGRKLQNRELIEFLKNRIGRTALLLFIADKADIGRSRFPTKHLATHESRKMDEHAAVNFFGDAGRLRFRENDTEIRWPIHYTPGLVGPGDLEKTPHLIEKKQGKKQKPQTNQNGDYRAFVPEVLRQGENTYDAWRKQFWSIYLDKIRLMAYATFALFPLVQRFRLEMHNPRVQHPDTISITPGNIERVFDAIRAQYEPIKQPAQPIQIFPRGGFVGAPGIA